MAKKNIKIKDEYDEIAEIEKSLEDSTGITARNRRKKERVARIATIIRGIIGFSKLLAVCSIVYSSIVIIDHIEGLVPKILILPQILLATYFAVDAFVTTSNAKRSKK